MDARIRESMEIWLTFASPQEIEDLMHMLLQEIGKRTTHPQEIGSRPA